MTMQKTSVLWMTSCFHLMAPMEQNKRRRVSSSSPGGGTGAKSEYTIALLLLFVLGSLLLAVVNA